MYELDSVGWDLGKWDSGNRISVLIMRKFFFKVASLCVHWATLMCVKTSQGYTLLIS